MTTDVDRLHEVALMENPPRRAGRTMYDCHVVAGAIEIGETSVIVFVPTMQYLRHVQPMLQRVLVEHGLRVLRGSQYEWEVGGVQPTARIRFKSATQRGLAADTAGYEGAVVDFNDDDPSREDPTVERLLGREPQSRPKAKNELGWAVLEELAGQAYMDGEE